MGKLIMLTVIRYGHFSLCSNFVNSQEDKTWEQQRKAKMVGMSSYSARHDQFLVRLSFFNRFITIYRKFFLKNFKSCPHKPDFFVVLEFQFRAKWVRSTLICVVCSLILCSWIHWINLGNIKLFFFTRIEPTTVWSGSANSNHCAMALPTQT